MFKVISEPAAHCEVCSVIWYFNAKNVQPAEICCKLVGIYGDIVMIDGMERKWVRQSNNGRNKVNDEARRVWPSVVGDNLVEKVNEKIHNIGGNYSMWTNNLRDALVKYIYYNLVKYTSFVVIAFEFLTFFVRYCTDNFFVIY